jgi:hypothetical protein
MIGIFSSLKIGVAVALMVAVAAAYWHYTSLVKERDELKIYSTLQKAELEKWQTQWDRMAEGLAEMDQLRREAREYHDEVQKLLAKHDLNKLALERPKMVERRVNMGTAKRWRVFECITGHPDCASGPDTSAEDSAGDDAASLILNRLRVRRGEGPVLLADGSVRKHGTERSGVRAVDAGSPRAA